MEWRVSDVSKLINSYRQYECLWNYKSSNYKRIDMKKNAWMQLSKEFNKDVDDVKKKIKHLRNAHVVEKKKMDSSKKSGSSAAAIYEPHLFYFNEMRFLDSVVVLRKTESSLEMGNLESSSEAGTEINSTTVENVSFPSTSRPINIRTEESPPSFNPQNSSGTSTTPEPMVHRRRPTQKSQKDSRYDKAIDAIVASVTAAESDDDFTAFSKTITLQLKQLPLADATETMSEIHLLVTRKVLSKMNNSRSDILQSAMNDADLTFEEMFSCSQ